MTSSSTDQRDTDSPQHDGYVSTPPPVLAPAPRRTSSGLSEKAEKELTSASFATLSLIRVAAVAAGLTWFAFLFVQTLPRLLSTFGQQPPWEATVAGIGFGFLALGAFAVMASALVHRPQVYRQIFRGAAGIYLVLVAVHIASMITLGTSPLTAMWLSAFAGIPMVLLLCTMSPALGVPVAIIVTALTCYFDHIPDSGWTKITILIHAVLQVLPFFILTSAAIFNGLRLDALAARAHQEASAVARLTSLREMELRFMAFVHDKVLNRLRAIASGALSPKPDAIDISTIADDASGPSLRLPVADIVLSMMSTVREIAPDTEFDFPEYIPYELTLQADVSAVLIDALREAAINSAKHAPGATRTCTIAAQWRGNELLELHASLHDSGPGFDTSRPHIGHAGARITILERTRATRGCDAWLYSQPDEGTSVDVSWTASREAESEPSTQSGIEIPEPFQLMGMSLIFGWWYVPIGLAYAIVMLLTADPFARPAESFGWWCVCVAATFVALLAIRRGHQVQLPLRESLIATGALVVYFSAAMAAQIPPRLQPWPDVWYLPFFVVLLTGLAMRQRGWFVIGALAYAAAAEYLFASGFTYLVSPGLYVAISSLPLIPAVLVPVMARRITRSLRFALATRRRETITVASVAAKRGYIAESTQWLQHQIDELDSRDSDNASHSARPPVTEFARLLELRLRDSIRSPMFDVPAITDAVWRARARGVEVRLLDDLSHAIYDAGGADSPDFAAARDSFLRVVQVELEALPSGTFTARFFPPGRDTMASIVIAADGATSDSDTSDHVANTRRLEFPRTSHAPLRG